MNWLIKVNDVAASVKVPPCSHPECSSSHWSRWRRRREGIEFNRCWYCGRQCLEAALSECISHYPRARVTTSSSVHRLPLGLLMLSRGTIDQHHLAAALQRKQKSPGRKIGECLADLGAVNEIQVTRALGAQHCLPVLLAYEPELDKSVPLQLQHSSQAICFRSQHSSNLMYVGFAAHVDHALVRAIESMMELQVEPCIIPSHVIAERLEAAQDRQRPMEFTFENNNSDADVVRSISSYAEQAHAERIRVIGTGHHLWARLDGSRNIFDLLFRTA